MHILPQRMDSSPHHTPRQLMVVAICHSELQAAGSSPSEKSIFHHVIAPYGYMAQDGRVCVVEERQDYFAVQWPYQREYDVRFRAARAPDDWRVRVVAEEIGKRRKNGKVAPGRIPAVEGAKARRKTSVLSLSSVDCFGWLCGMYCTYVPATVAGAFAQN